MNKIKDFIIKNKILCISLSSVLVLCIIAGTIIGVNSKNEPKKQEKKNESSMSSTGSDNNNSEYTTSVNENGETVVVDKNGDVVSAASVSENGDIVVKDKTGKETVAVKAKDVKKYTDKETENNNGTVDSESHTESSSVSSASSNSGLSENKPSGSGSGNNKPSTGQESGGSQTTTPSTGGGTTPSQPSQPTQPNNQLPTASQLAAIENEFFNLVNEERARVGAPALTRNATLNQAAKIRANEQLSLYSHTRPNGTEWSTVFQEVKYGKLEERITSTDGINWVKEMVYSYGAGAENLETSGGSDYSNVLNNYAKSSFSGFRYSQAHYSSMINSNYKNTGIAMSFKEANNNGVKILQIYTVQLFTTD